METTNPTHIFIRVYRDGRLVVMLQTRYGAEWRTAYSFVTRDWFSVLAFIEATYYVSVVHVRIQGVHPYPKAAK